MIETETKEEKKLYTYEEYLELEKVSDVRLEYNHGEVSALAGSTKRHNRIVMNIYNCLDQLVEHRPCDVFSSDVKLELAKEDKYVYPDVLLTCSEEDLKDDNESSIRHPSLIVEVLSGSTENYDRNDKFKEYINIPSLNYYLLVSQKQKKVELYSRQKHDFWFFKIFEGDKAIIKLENLKLSLPLEKIYQKISF